MATIFSKEELRQKRRLLYQDPVFLVTHEVLHTLLRSLDIVELSILAEHFTQGLLAHPPIDHSLMVYEVDDLRDDLAAVGPVSDSSAVGPVPDSSAVVAVPDSDFLLLLILSLVKLYALRHVHPDARPLLRQLLPFCQEYQGFKDLLGSFIVKEQQLRHQGKLVFQKRQLHQQRSAHLQAGVQGAEPLLSEARAFVARFVSNCACLTPTTMEHVLLPLMVTNEQCANAFDAEVNQLIEKLGIKTTPVIQPLVQGDLVMEKRVEHEVSGVGKDGVGVIIKQMAPDLDAIHTTKI